MADRPGTGLGVRPAPRRALAGGAAFFGRIERRLTPSGGGDKRHGEIICLQARCRAGERLRFSGADFLVRAAADTTGGAFSIIEEIDPLDTPLHRHANEDEIFYVIKGEHVFRCGDQEFRVGPGGTMFAPRGVPHAHKRVLPRTGRFLTMTSPAGFEGFFRELSAAEASGAAMPEAYAAVSRKYGIDWL
ncbi:cupin domain-containing protein [Mesorhizobium sp. P5_C1]